MVSGASESSREWPTLLVRVTPDRSPWIRVAAVFAVTALTAIAAQISVPLPFTPVPLTFQPMVVLLGAAALGAHLGLTAQVMYLAAGVVGVPVFAASAVLPQGVARLIGPTGGYLLAYPFAAYVTGWLAERGWDRRYWTALAAMAAGLVVIFTGGVLWLALLARPVAPGVSGAIGMSQALATGLLAFLPADLIKLMLAAGILPSLWRVTRVRKADRSQSVSEDQEPLER